MTSTVEAALERATATFATASQLVRARERVDLTGLNASALALFLAENVDRPTLVVTADRATAQRTQRDLSFFLGEDGAQRALLLSEPELSAYAEVTQDRRGVMDRMATLLRLANATTTVVAAPALKDPSTSELGERGAWFIVTSVGAVMKRWPPRHALLRHETVIEVGQELDRDELLRNLSASGYLRVPVAEDPGTFAVRGALLDVFAAQAPYPARVELDDNVVASVKYFEPDDQRTREELQRLAIAPARTVVLGESELERARLGVRALCDDAEVPSSRVGALLDGIEGEVGSHGAHAWLPAFYDKLDSVFDYVGQQSRVVVLDTSRVRRAAADEYDRIATDYEARRTQGAPVYSPEQLYLTPVELLQAMEDRPRLLAHGFRWMTGPEAQSAQGDEPVEPDEPPNTDSTSQAEPLATLEQSPADGDALHLAGEDQRLLQAELRQTRADGHRVHTLKPLASRLTSWQEEGLRVVLCARTAVQADRLRALLNDHGQTLDPAEGHYRPNQRRASSARAQIVVGALSAGFILATEATVFVTEEEVFGPRRQRGRQAKRKTHRRAFSEDLRSLKEGDFVVHVQHGVGRYLGQTRKGLGQSQLERMHGRGHASVEVLIVEYRGGDRLMVPVTRLEQIQKFADSEGQTPKLDRLGGQTFAKTKARVQKSVRQLAEDLLKNEAQRLGVQRDALAPVDSAYAEFEAGFAYEETPDQLRTIDEVMGDLEGQHPMDRVICGDVGFGKTEVALRAAFRIAMAGRQVAMLCPTTILAQQHFTTFRERLADYPLRVEMLSRFVTGEQQKATLQGVKEGGVDIVVGTHRLLSKDVLFKRLGLLVVDEEQRFGVAHKERIKAMRAGVDVLTLSATPIPRTLHMAMGGLRELSLIMTPPVDRRAVRTLVTRWDARVLADAIEHELQRGGQLFFVHNRIESLHARAQQLQELAPRARIALAHGRLREATLERTMGAFVNGEYDILCSTAIVENGLDIARANTIMIDRADTFGLSQLYQIRGRVGRSHERAYCYLITPPPSRMSDEARRRVEALERFTQLGSGFRLSTLDMELRGAGDLLGAEQSGNVASVGIEMYVQMLEEATAELKGASVVHDVDPELTLDLEHFLPEDYVDDLGLRLSFYKRFGGAEDEEQVRELAEELEDRFGAPPQPARDFVRVMALKPGLRRLRALGCDARGDRVALHLRADTPLDVARLAQRVATQPAQWRLSADQRVTRRFEPSARMDAVERVQTMLAEIAPLQTVEEESTDNKGAS